MPFLLRDILLSDKKHMDPERKERAMDNIHGRPVGPDGEELFDEMYPVASSMECTGLIPAAPAAPAEVDSYSDIYDIPRPTRPPRSRSTNPKRGDNFRDPAQRRYSGRRIHGYASRYFSAAADRRGRCAKMFSGRKAKNLFTTRRHHAIIHIRMWDAPHCVHHPDGGVCLG